LLWNPLSNRQSRQKLRWICAEFSNDLCTSTAKSPSRGVLWWPFLSRPLYVDQKVRSFRANISRPFRSLEAPRVRIALPRAIWRPTKVGSLPILAGGSELSVFRYADSPAGGVRLLAFHSARRSTDRIMLLLRSVAERNQSNFESKIVASLNLYC
jgi:hypothetical protein